jgi:Methyltransferase domain/Glycosyl transferases group 1
MDSAHFLYRPIVFHTPARVVDPPSWLAHTPFAFWIVDALRPATFVELGCHSGNSYSSFAQAVQTLHLPTACYAVDTWLGDPHAGTFDESVFAEWSEYHERRFSSFSRLVRSTFDAALEHFPDGAIDLLHIDGYHTFDAVSHDFEAWRPKVSGRGVVLCHDINVREKDFGAWRLWERVAREYPSFAFRHGHGLGVLGIGRDLPEPLEWLFAADADEANAARMFFARLGASVTAQQAAAAAQDAAAEAQQALAAELAGRDDRFHQASSELDALRSEHARLLDALASTDHAWHARSAEVARLTAENVELKGHLESAEQALTARIGEVEALASRLEARETRRTHPTIVVVSHVGAWQPRAGNEYRLHRMFQWYRRQGYRVIPVIAPLPGEELARDALAATAAAFGNAIQVHRDGRIEHDLRDVPEEFAPVPNHQAVLAAVDETGISTSRKQEVLKLESMFCHDRVIATVLHLQQWLGPHVLQVEYIWMTRLLPLVRADVLKVLDTIDVFSSIDRKVRIFGVHDVTVDPHEEAERLRRGDLIVAIQDDERQELQRLAPGLPVVTAGVDFDVVADAAGSIAGRILFIASGNPRNCKGLTDFLRLAWPRIRRSVPDAELVVVGAVAAAVAGRRVPGLTVAGAVNDVAPLYREAALVINPVVAGTGVKIKTIEALCHLRPIVTWPAGVDGLDPRLAARCVVGRDWYEFANAVVDALTTRDGRRFTDDDRAVIAELVSPETTYAALDHAYRTFFERHRTAPEPVVRSLPDAGLPVPAVAHGD